MLRWLVDRTLESSYKLSGHAVDFTVTYFSAAADGTVCGSSESSYKLSGHAVGFTVTHFSTLLQQTERFVGRQNPVTN